MMFLDTETGAAPAQQQPKALLEEPKPVAIGCNAVSGWQTEWQHEGPVVFNFETPHRINLRRFNAFYAERLGCFSKGSRDSETDRNI